MPETTTARLRIDIVSDVVCPWCIIGYKQLERALDRTGTAAEVHWHPFELNPGMAPDGENLREHLAAKYGTTPEGSRAARTRLTALGAELGFTFNYADDMRMYNTFRAHQLLHWAGAQGHQHRLKMALFGSFFTERRDLNDPQVLADAAARVGLDRDEALAVLADGRFADAVREEERFWTARGVTGVPAVVFDRRHLLVGAQGVENYTRVLEALAAERAA
ncbi:MAG: DsbA family oxidoreductase [Kiloniellales bacterium]|nr:DsbA family oxidoreductase [Kiloniellales bacterium]